MAMLDESAVHSLRGRRRAALSRELRRRCSLPQRCDRASVYMTRVHCSAGAQALDSIEAAAEYRVAAKCPERCRAAHAAAIESVEREEYEAFIARRQQTLTVERDAQSFERMPRRTSRRLKAPWTFCCGSGTGEEERSVSPARRIRAGDDAQQRKNRDATLAEIYASREYEER